MGLTKMVVWRDLREPGMSNESQIFQQSIYINAPLKTVERTIVDRTLMHRWLNPLLACEPIGEWTTEVGSQFRFYLKIPLLQPTLQATVVERQPGLVVWQFSGFFEGSDRWQCSPESSGTRLLNCFEFQIHNPLVAFGFNTLAASLTRADMQAQLQRLKQVAEELSTAELNRSLL